MSSSISSSDGRWRAFVRTFAVVAGAVFAALVGAAVALDPYDTGRFALLRKPGVLDQGPRTANASRGRDPAFDGAIVGNSHIQLVSPEELAHATGIPFVSLIVPGTGPREQFAILDYFLRTRVRPARALVLGLDGFWCTDDPALPIWNPFPFWLYDPSPTAYLRGLVRYATLGKMVDRLRVASGKGKRARPDGYWDYEQYRVWRRDAIASTLALRDSSLAKNTTGAFPALDALAPHLARVPADVPVVLVRPPVYVTALPEPGTPEARVEEGCRAAIRRVAEGRPRTALVDWRSDRPETRAIENWFDHTHYRAQMARALEAEIADALRGLGAPGL
jgi:hypothetical protein